MMPTYRSQNKVIDNGNMLHQCSIEPIIITELPLQCTLQFNIWIMIKLNKLPVINV